VTTNGHYSYGIYAYGGGPNAPLTIVNSWTVKARGHYGFGIYARTYGAKSGTTIINSGNVYGSYAGIYTVDYSGTTIINTGNVSAGSQRAISVLGAPAKIYNSGHITGFVDLSYQGDTFINQAGGVFEAKLTSYFETGNDLFVNQNGGTVQAASNSQKSEKTSFVQPVFAKVDTTFGDNITGVGGKAGLRVVW